LKNFPEFYDKIYNPYNKQLQKCLESLKNTMIKFKKKMSKILKKLKKKIVNDEILKMFCV